MFAMMRDFVDVCTFCELARPRIYVISEHDSIIMFKTIKQKTERQTYATQENNDYSLGKRDVTQHKPKKANQLKVEAELARIKEIKCREKKREP